MAAVLVTLTTAKAHLKITTPDGHPGDADIQQKLDASEGKVRKHLKAQDDPTWDPTTVPSPIVEAILVALSGAYDDRGDGDQKAAADNAARWQAILIPFRDPALA